jgi:hypothetical protein
VSLAAILPPGRIAALFVFLFAVGAVLQGGSVSYKGGEERESICLQIRNYYFIRRRLHGSV